MVLAELFSLALYILSLVILHDYFGESWLQIIIFTEKNVIIFFHLQIGTSFGHMNFCGKCWPSHWSLVCHYTSSNSYDANSLHHLMQNCREMTRSSGFYILSNYFRPMAWFCTTRIE